MINSVTAPLDTLHRIVTTIPHRATSSKQARSFLLSPSFTVILTRPVPPPKFIIRHAPAERWSPGTGTRTHTRTRRRARRRTVQPRIRLRLPQWLPGLYSMHDPRLLPHSMLPECLQLGQRADRSADFGCTISGIKIREGGQRHAGLQDGIWVRGSLGCAGGLGEFGAVAGRVGVVRAFGDGRAVGRL